MVGNIMIKPDHILHWLRKMELHWPCFCTLLCEDLTMSKSSRIECSEHGAFAICGHSPARCGFFSTPLFCSFALFFGSFQALFPFDSVDLTAIHALTDFKAEYEAPPIGEDKKATHLRILGTTLMRACTHDPQHGPPYQTHYWGEYQQERQAGSFAALAAPARLPSPGWCFISRSFDLTSVSHIRFAGPSHTVDALNQNETLLFASLGQGEGISQEAANVLFTSCPSCGRVFVSRFLAAHHRLCKYDSIILEN